jgi:hypothetical protein
MNMFEHRSRPRIIKNMLFKITLLNRVSAPTPTYTNRRIQSPLDRNLHRLRALISQMRTIFTMRGMIEKI